MTFKKGEPAKFISPGRTCLLDRDPIYMEMLLKAAAKGAPNELIAKMFDVERGTVREWLSREDVAQAVGVRRAQWALDRLDEMDADYEASRKGDKPLWQINAWRLERSMPESFANNTKRIEHTGEGGGPIRFEGPKSVVYVIAQPDRGHEDAIEGEATEVEPLEIGPGDDE